MKLAPGVSFIPVIGPFLGPGVSLASGRCGGGSGATNLVRRPDEACCAAWLGSTRWLQTDCKRTSDNGPSGTTPRGSVAR